jgi:alpha/beta hydrolase fold
MNRRTGPVRTPRVGVAGLSDFTGLAPAYIEVGSLDIIRGESFDYAQKLLKAAVDAEFHLHLVRQCPIAS